MHGLSVHFYFWRPPLKEKLARLKLLQAVDQVLDGLQQQRASLPQQVAELEAELAKLQALAQSVTQVHKDLVAQKKKRELDQAEELDRVKKYEARLREIKTNREYQALLREIGFAKKAAAEIEEELSKLNEDIKARKDEVAKAEAAVTSKEQEISVRRKETEKTLKEVEKSFAVESKRREELLKDIPRDLLSRYNLIRRRTNLVVVNAKSGACQGCFMALPPQLYNQVRRLDNLYTCPNCHRILLYEPQPAPEAAKV